ncbi:MAG: acylneuraminate cytidylyltransferase family protein [Lachnospiraceae bacterium]|nr:acylneuraminate cytidylyltransferase family protein [Lachnospiraceae bacterium]
MKENILAIIPARSGSKGLKDKNIKDLCGKPMMAYTIEAAAASGIFNTIHVSTDSEQYAQIAMQYGADVPFLRDANYATDQSSSWDVVDYVLEEYKKLGKQFTMIALLQPTTPLRTAENIKGAYEVFLQNNANAVVSVCEVDHPPLWTDVLPKDGNMKGFVAKEYREVPRQQMPVYYRVNGAIYLMKTEMLTDIINLYDRNCYAYVMDKNHSIDIDDEYDFRLVEYMKGNL